MSPTKPRPSFPLLFVLVAFGSVGAALFTPSLPQIQSYFHLSVSDAQKTISYFVLGYAIGQLPYGPLANGLGRKKALFIGLIIAMIGSLLCAFSYHAHSFSLLVWGRFIQSVGGAVGVKISFTMVADVYDQTTATKKISKLLIAFAVMPGVAIAMGGWLTETFGWWSCFYFLTAFSIVILLFSLSLPETGEEINKKYLRLRPILEGYGAKFKNKKLMLAGLIMGCGTAIVYIFAAKAPFIGIQTIGLSPQIFGYLNLIPSAGMIIGSVIAGRLAGRLPFFHMIALGLIGSFVAACFMFFPFLLDHVSWAFLFFPIAGLYAAESLIYCNITSYGLASSKNKSNGSAVLNFINVSMAFLAVLFAEYIYPESNLLLPAAILFLLGALLAFAIWLQTSDRSRKKES